MVTTVLRRQFFTALADATEMNNIYQSIVVNSDDPVWIEFWAAKYIRVGDPLYIHTQLVLGYTSAQMQTLFDLAVQVPA